MVSYVVRTTSSRPLEALSKVDSLVVPWKRPVLKWPHVSSSSLQLNMTEPGLTTRKVPVSGLTFSYLKQKKIKWRVTRDVTKLDTSKYIMAFFFFFAKRRIDPSRNTLYYELCCGIKKVTSRLNVTISLSTRRTQTFDTHWATENSLVN